MPKQEYKGRDFYGNEEWIDLPETRYELLFRILIHKPYLKLFRILIRIPFHFLLRLLCPTKWRISEQGPGFPYNWTKPGEIRYDKTGMFLVKGWWPWVNFRALFRRHILRLPRIFWMLDKKQQQKPPRK